MPLHLTAAQFRILTALAAADGAVLSIRQIAHLLYERSHPLDTQRVRAHMVRLRRKLRVAAPELAASLITIRSEGYRLTEPLPSSPGWRRG